MWYYKDKLLGMYYNILFLAYFFTPNFLTIIIMAHYRNPIMSHINALFVYSFGVYCIYALQCTHTSHNCNQLGKKRYTISSMCVFCSQLELASQSLHSYKAHNVRICLVVLHSLHRIINKWQTRTGSASRRLRLFPSSGAPELHFLRQANGLFFIFAEI